MSRKSLFKYQGAASLLPFWVLSKLHNRWKLGYDECDGFTFWLESSYLKWCRKDKRKEKRLMKHAV